MGDGPWNRLAASEVLCKISTLDFDLGVEMAVVATGLVAATQVRYPIIVDSLLRNAV